MKQFLKYFLASGLAYIVFGLIFLLISIGIVSSFFNKGPKPIMVKDQSVLHIEFDRPIGELTYSKPQFTGDGIDEVGKIGVKSVTDAIDYAATDDKIKGIYLDISSLNSGMATAEEVRNSLKRFKESKKFIVAYSEMYTKGGYYMASLADEIYLYPTGIVEWNGLGSERMFFKNMLEKLDVDVQIIRGSNNKFKSAVEPFMLEKMSEANRLQTERFLNSFWNHIVTEVGAQRDLSAEDLNLIADQIKIHNAQSAVDEKLVTALKYEDEVADILKEKLELKDDEKINVMPLSKYVKYVDRKNTVKEKATKNIAVVYATGEIRSGKGSLEMIGSETTAKHIREARKNDSIKAVVLRVNSPGGSALASDVIWREVMLTKKVKPVVVSMGDVAASGGYYISCGADRIFAQPNTITGSIGVFGMIPNMEGFFNNKLGITFDYVQTNKHANIMTVSKPLTEEEYTIIQKGVDEIYNDFITKVAAGRGISKEMVDSIGQGRVWTGTDAKEIKLVDEIGGLNDAIAYAAKLAALDEVAIMTLPKPKTSPLEEFLTALDEEKEGENEDEISIKSPNMNSQMVKQLFNYMERLEYLYTHPSEQIQARLPYEISFY